MNASYTNDVLWRTAQEMKLLETIIEVCQEMKSEYRSSEDVIGNLRILMQSYPYIADDLQVAIDKITEYEATIDRLRANWNDREAARP